MADISTQEAINKDCNLDALRKKLMQADQDSKEVFLGQKEEIIISLEEEQKSRKLKVRLAEQETKKLCDIRVIEGRKVNRSIKKMKAKVEFTDQAIVWLK